MILTKEIVLEIYNRLSKGEFVGDLSKEYEISQSSIANIKKGRHKYCIELELQEIILDPISYHKRLSEKRSGKNNGMYGKRHKEESIKTIGEKKKGQQSYWKGKKLSEEYKRKVSEGMKKAYIEGRTSSPLGKMGNGQKATPAEELLSKYLLSLGFIQELPVHSGKFGGAYRLDFAHEQLKLDIEVDGPQHYTEPKIIERDRIRDEYLKSIGWTIMRFPNDEILNNPSQVVIGQIMTKMQELLVNQ